MVIFNRKEAKRRVNSLTRIIEMTTRSHQRYANASVF